MAEVVVGELNPARVVLLGGGDLQLRVRRQRPLHRRIAIVPPMPHCPLYADRGGRKSCFMTDV